MSQKDIVSPLSVVDTNQCTIIPPWFVECTEFPPTHATYKPLVNGEEAFRAVHEAIANAKKTVDIICWGFQPSMYFIRDGQAPCIGELLINLAQEKNVQVRILGWEMFLNATGLGGEANLPGYGLINLKNRAGQTSSDDQYAYDKKWFSKHFYSDEMAVQVLRSGKKNSEDLFPMFVGRGFDANERAEIAFRASRQALDKSVSGGTVFALTMAATHHQKTVLVDYELPEQAVGFVMGHNMLDEYWDTNEHSSKHRPSAQDH